MECFLKEENDIDFDVLDYVRNPMPARVAVLEVYEKTKCGDYACNPMHKRVTVLYQK
jgi:regulation of enolase protein 1 (concanavalin A-like superfamily)